VFQIDIDRIDNPSHRILRHLIETGKFFAYPGYCFRISDIHSQDLQKMILKMFGKILGTISFIEKHGKMIGKNITVLEADSFHTLSQIFVYELWDADLP